MTSSSAQARAIVFAKRRQSHAPSCCSDSAPRCVAEFPHLAAAEPRERRREAERLVRAGLQVLLQHSVAATHLVAPEPSRTNLAPESYQLYSARPEAALRCLMQVLPSATFPGLAWSRARPVAVVVMHSWAGVSEHEQARDEALPVPLTGARTRCRMPHCLLHIRDRYASRENEDAGALHEAVAEALLRHGRLTLEQAQPPSLPASLCTAPAGCNCHL